MRARYPRPRGLPPESPAEALRGLVVVRTTVLRSASCSRAFWRQRIPRIIHGQALSSRCWARICFLARTAPAPILDRMICRPGYRRRSAPCIIAHSAERWQSGRMRRTRNPVYGFAVTWVRIPPFPPDLYLYQGLFEGENRRRSDEHQMVLSSAAGLPALQRSEPGQGRKAAATAIHCKCRGLGSPPMPAPAPVKSWI